MLTIISTEAVQTPNAYDAYRELEEITTPALSLLGCSELLSIPVCELVTKILPDVQEFE